MCELSDYCLNSRRCDDCRRYWVDYMHVNSMNSLEDLYEEN